MRKLFLKLRNNNSGAAYLLTVIGVTILSLVITTSLLIRTELTYEMKELKNVFNIAVRSASLQFNHDEIPNGRFVLDAVKAEEVAVDLICKNINCVGTPTKGGGYYTFKDQKGLETLVFISIHANEVTVSPTYLPLTSIPPAITNVDVSIPITKPSIFIVGVTKIQINNPFWKSSVNIPQWAVGQLNAIPPEMQPSHTR